MMRLLLVLLMVLIASPASAFIEASRGVVSGGGCTTTIPNELGALVEYITFGTASYPKISTRFTATKTTTICSVSIGIAKNTVIAGNYTASIYTGTGGWIGTKIGNTSASVPYSSLNAVGTMFTGLNAPIVSGGEYFIVVENDSPSDSNYARASTTATANNKYVIRYNGATWELTSSTRSIIYSLYE